MYGRKYMGILRSAFLIDEKGKIAEAWYKVQPEGHAGQPAEGARLELRQVVWHGAARSERIGLGKAVASSE